MEVHNWLWLFTCYFILSSAFHVIKTVKDHFWIQHERRYRSPLDITINARHGWCPTIGYRAVSQCSLDLAFKLGALTVHCTSHPTFPEESRYAEGLSASLWRLHPALSKSTEKEGGGGQSASSLRIAQAKMEKQLGSLDRTAALSACDLR